MSERKIYPTDLSEQEWEQLKDLLPQKLTPLDKAREYINAILYIDRSGGSWRMMPHDLPNWSTVYTYFRKLNRDGTWERVNDALRVRLRQKAGRAPEPSLLIGDSQSVKTTEKGGRAAGTVASM
jgi:putative transposase